MGNTVANWLCFFIWNAKMLTVMEALQLHLDYVTVYAPTFGKCNWKYNFQFLLKKSPEYFFFIWPHRADYCFNKHWVSPTVEWSLTPSLEIHGHICTTVLGKKGYKSVRAGKIMPCSPTEGYSPQNIRRDRGVFFLRRTTSEMDNQISLLYVAPCATLPWRWALYNPCDVSIQSCLCG